MNIRESFFELLDRQFSPFEQLSPEQGERLFAHYELLARWNAVINLTSIDRVDKVVVRHYCESLFLSRLLPREGVTVLDLGSGGGFPGVPMAVASPANRFVLCESHQRKAVFLQEATRAYGNVRVFPRRAEDLQERFDWVVSRAVKPLDVLKIARRLGDHVALLMSEADLAAVRNVKGIAWQPPAKLPWRELRVAAIGALERDVPRGT